MKIAVVSNLFPPFSVGGYEKLCGRVCEELASLGHEIVVLTSSYGGTASAPNGQIVERCLKLLANEDDIYRPFEPRPDERDAIIRWNKAQVSRFNQEHKPDLWFVWNLYFFDNEFIEWLSSFGKRVVLFLTDNWLVAARQPDAIGQFFRRYVHGPESFRSAANGASGNVPMGQWAIFGSRFVGELYKSFGFAFDREIVIHNGVELPVIPSELYVPRNEPRESGRLKVLFAGRVVDLKGPQLVVAALPLIKSQLGQEVSLTIVGDTQDEAFSSRLKTDIVASSCADCIAFRTPVSETLLQTLFNDHDVYVFPSLYEPFSLTLIHAIGAGIPTVATDVGGNGEIVKDGETGLLFDKNSPVDLANSVLRIAKDPQLRTHLSREGRRFARRFTFRRMVTRIENELLRAAG